MDENREVRQNGVTRWLYRVLLRLLPRTRRDRFGDEMAVVFDDQRQAARHDTAGLGAPLLWMKEATGMARFSLHEWVTRMRARAGSGRGSRMGRGGRFSTELRWAWRGVRARGWRAVFIVLLLAVAMAANTVVFSAADAFVFNRAPYWQPDRLAVIEKHSTFGVNDYQFPDAITVWRQQTALFSGVQAHAQGASIYLTSQGITDAVRAEQVTPGLFELLGVLPASGRPFRSDDAEAGATPTAIISDSLARRLFGTPANAVDNTIDAGTDRLRVVGVMPAGFRFPSSREEVWRPLDLESWRKNSGVRDIVRLAPGRTVDDVSRIVSEQAPSVNLAALGRATPDTTAVRLLTDAWRNTSATVIFAMLLGAASCLFLIACANVASLELHAAAHRSRTYAVQAALGAPRGVLVRGALFEGGLVLGAATIAGAALVTLAAPLIMTNLTASMRDVLVNPIDLDVRALMFMALIAAVAWALTSLPAAVRSMRVNLVDALRDDPRVMPVTWASARLRQILMAGQVALTVLLLVGALLYLRTYSARLGLDKGFDAPGLVSVVVYPADDAPMKGADLEARVLDTLRASPGVRGVSRTYSLPPSTEAGIGGWLHIKDLGSKGRVKLAGYTVDPSYFQTMGIPLMAGRAFSDESSSGEMVVDDAFARKYWPAGDALGAKLKIGGEHLDYDTQKGGASFGGASEFEIVGITNRLRADLVQTPAGDNVFFVYTRLGAKDVPLTFVARLQDGRQLPALTDAVRKVAVRSIVRTDTLANRYAALDADKRLAAVTTSAFGVLALIIAVAGIYAVMACLVAGRTREIGIRMALGADRAAVRRLIFGSSLRFVLAGAGLGLLAALVMSRWIAAQLYGVTATDPATYTAVTGLVIVTALIATWLPARQAARVDPAVTLRAE
jgi:predicted permease